MMNYLSFGYWRIRRFRSRLLTILAIGGLASIVIWRVSHATMLLNSFQKASHVSRIKTSDESNIKSSESKDFSFWRCIAGLPQSEIAEIRFVYDDKGFDQKDVELVCRSFPIVSLKIHGGELEDIDFLRDVTGLKHFSFSSETVENLSPISEATNLQGINLASLPAKELTLSNLKKLKYLLIARTGIESLEISPSSSSLKVLRLFDNKQMISLKSNWDSLEFLQVEAQPGLTLKGFSMAKNLKILGLKDIDVPNLEFIRQQSQLEEIQLENVPLENFEDFRDLPSIKLIFFDGVILPSSNPNLEPLKKYWYSSRIFKAFGYDREYVDQWRTKQEKD